MSTAIERIDRIRSRLDRRHEDDDADELVGLAVRRLVSEPFDVLSKGLNPSRFDSWSRGARSKVARRFGSSSDLTHEVLSRSINPNRGDLSSLLGSAGEVIAGGEPFTETARAFGLAFYQNLARDDGFRVQVLAWSASRNRASLSTELCELYESVEERVAGGIAVILESCGRRARPGLTVHEQAGMLIAVIEGAAMQGQVRGDDELARRFSEYVAFLLEHGSEPLD